MPEGPTIVDASCLIGLEAINRLTLLEQLYGPIHIPKAVANEWSMAPPDWIMVQSVQNQTLVQSLHGRLGAGESETIAYALECAPARVILDDKRARQIAKQFDLPITGTVGVIVRAKERGFVSAVEPVLNELRAVGFAISDRLKAEALRLARE